MSTDLEQFRDHCRKEATRDLPITRNQWDPSVPGNYRIILVAETPTPEQRALWTRLADEVDAYLAAPDDQALW